MPSTVTEFDVFVSGPDDVVDEKDEVEEVIQELNRLFRDDYNARLNVVVWPTDIVPGAGERPQEVILDQIRGEFDIYIGILWTHFGTQTGEAGSGTEEEFRMALEEKRQGDAPLSIQVYFKMQSPSNLGALDPEQWTKVSEFREGLSETGVLYATFDDARDLAQQLRFNLKRIISEWANKTPVEGEAPEPGKSTKGERDFPVKEREKGFFDLIEEGEESADRLVTIGGEITQATVEFGRLLEERTEELKSLDSDDPLAASKARQILSQAAANIRTYAGKIDDRIQPLGDNFESMIDAWSRAATLWDEDFSGDIEHVVKARENAIELLEVTRSTSDTINQFRQIMDNMPRATKAIIHAKAQGSDVLGRLHRRLNQGVGKIEDARDVFDDIIDGHGDG